MIYEEQPGNKNKKILDKNREQNNEWESNEDQTKEKCYLKV